MQNIENVINAAVILTVFFFLAMLKTKPSKAPFPPGINIRPEWSDHKYRCDCTQDALKSDHSDHMQTWPGLHMATFFKQCVFKCHHEGLPTQPTSSAKQQGIKTPQQQVKMILIHTKHWFRFTFCSLQFKSTCLGTLTCRDKQQLFVNTLSVSTDFTIEQVTAISPSLPWKKKKRKQKSNNFESGCVRRKLSFSKSYGKFLDIGAFFQI